MKIGQPIVHFLTIESTQDEAKRHLKGVYWTTDQTAGRGRFDRTWYSEPGKSLAVSIALPEYKNFPKPFLISIWICLGLAEAFDLKVQWPNDLVVNKKKVCGILTEIIDGVPVVGIGMNVGKMTFPEDLALRGSSLANEDHLHITTNQAFEKLMMTIERLPAVPGVWEAIEEKWRLYDDTDGKIFRLHDGRVGIAEGISDAGELIWNGRGEYEIVTFAEALWGPQPEGELEGV